MQHTLSKYFCCEERNIEELLQKYNINSSCDDFYGLCKNSGYIREPEEYLGQLKQFPFEVCVLQSTEVDREAVSSIKKKVSVLLVLRQEALQFEDSLGNIVRPRSERKVRWGCQEKGR